MIEKPERSSPVVLLCEADILVRIPLAGYLRDCGYRVIEAVNGEEALTVFKQVDVTVDALLTDAQLPGTLDGFSLCQWVRVHKPDVQIAMAGSPRAAAVEAGNLCEDGPQLQKPYHPQTVHERIRQLVARRDAGKN